ncbi:MAG: sigma-70 family RNA polymerase sigma factor [Clostridiales bacterium]|nr:sigma-70 family RNA polymerase sigma factor [Clostridiales bacterium]
MKKDDNELLNYLINTYSSYIFSIVNRICDKSCSVEDIEECVSDIIISLWRNSEKIDFNKGTLKTYIAATSRNTAINLLKSTKTRKFFLPIKEDVLSFSDDPIDTILKKENNEAILDFLSQLNEIDRKIFIKRFYFGDSYKKISKDLNIKVRIIEGKIYRCRIKLKKFLTGEGSV